MGRGALHKAGIHFYHFFFFNCYFLRALSSEVNSLDGFRSPEQSLKQLLMEITKSFLSSVDFLKSKLQKSPKLYLCPLGWYSGLRDVQCRHITWQVKNS